MEVDPLSAIGTTLALFGAVFAILKALDLVQTARTETVRLEQEVEHLKDATDDLRHCDGNSAFIRNFRDAESKILQARIFLKRWLHGKRVRLVVFRRRKVAELSKDVGQLRSRLLDYAAISSLSVCLSLVSLPSIRLTLSRSVQRASSQSQVAVRDSYAAKLNGHTRRHAALENYFERRPTFLPEQYAIFCRLNESIVASAMLEISHTGAQRVHRYYLYYAETPRTWQRITVTATITSMSSDSSFPAYTSPEESSTVCRTLPSNLGGQFEDLLRGKRLSASVTDVSLEISEEADGVVSVNRSSAICRPDPEESRLNSHGPILKRLIDLGCPWYREEDLLRRSRRTASSYLVWVQGHTYLEQRIPFAGAGLAGRNEVSEFFNDIEVLHSLTSCKGVVRFAGIVVDSSQRHIKGYLHEWPSFGGLKRVFHLAESWKLRISWSIRWSWARQLVEAVAQLHEKQIVLGVLTINEVYLRFDGSIVLTCPKSSGNPLTNTQGSTPPELRSGSHSRSQLNFSTDIFQLGLLIWLIVQQTARCPGVFCRCLPCTSKPLCACKADHTNPVQLPICTRRDVPKTVNDLIARCRETDPKARPKAQQLLAFFNVDTDPPQLASLVRNLPEADGVESTVCCSSCGLLCTHLHYHCNSCQNGDFDLCYQCYMIGQRCSNREHQLLKRIWSGSSIVTACDY